MTRENFDKKSIKMYRKKKVVKPTTVEVLKEELRHQLVYGESVRSLGTQKILKGYPRHTTARESCRITLPKLIFQFLGCFPKLLGEKS